MFVSKKARGGFEAVGSAGGEVPRIGEGVTLRNIFRAFGAGFWFSGLYSAHRAFDLSPVMDLRLGWLAMVLLLVSIASSALSMAYGGVKQ